MRCTAPGCGRAAALALALLLAALCKLPVVSLPRSCSNPSAGPLASAGPVPVF